MTSVFQFRKEVLPAYDYRSLCVQPRLVVSSDPDSTKGYISKRATQTDYSHQLLEVLQSSIVAPPRKEPTLAIAERFPLIGRWCWLSHAVKIMTLFPISAWVGKQLSESLVTDTFCWLKPEESRGLTTSVPCYSICLN